MTNSKVKKGQRIIWAIDPFEEQGETRSHVISTLQELSDRGASIEPVYVLSPDQYDVNLEFNAPWLKQIRPSVQKVLDHYLANVSIEGVKNPQVLIQKRPSLTRSIHTLANYANRTEADAIVVGTHAKSGVSRLFLGSFAESLLLYSKVPVIVVGPHSEVSRHEGKNARILFSTDFGRSAQTTFRKVVALAKAYQAKVTLFHCLPHTVLPLVQSGVYLLNGGYLSFPDFLTRDEEKKLKVAREYINAARKHGVEVEMIFNPGHDSTSQAIVNQAQKEKSGLIVMAAESGAVSAALIGSVTRQVVRSAPCPVWVLRAS